MDKKYGTLFLSGFFIPLLLLHKTVLSVWWIYVRHSSLLLHFFPPSMVIYTMTIWWGFHSTIALNHHLSSKITYRNSSTHKPPLSTHTIALNHHLSSKITYLNSSTPKPPLSTHTIALNHHLSSKITYLNFSTSNPPLSTHTIALNDHLSSRITHHNSCTPKPSLSTQNC